MFTFTIEISPGSPVVVEGYLTRSHASGYTDWVRDGKRDSEFLLVEEKS